MWENVRQGVRPVLNISDFTVEIFDAMQRPPLHCLIDLLCGHTEVYNS